MRLIEIIRYEREKQTVFVTRSTDGDVRWRIDDDARLTGWERVYVIDRWSSTAPEHRGRNVLGEKHQPTYPRQRPWWLTRSRLNTWRAEYLMGRRTARPAKEPALEPPAIPLGYEFSATHTPTVAPLVNDGAWFA